MPSAPSKAQSDDSPASVDLGRLEKAEESGKDAGKDVAEDGSIYVDWEPDDVRHPRNWPRGRKWAAVAAVSSFTFITPLASSMMAPAAAEISAALGNTNATIEIMLTSIFVAAFAIGPLLLAPISEWHGRTRVLQVGNAVFLVFNLVCAFAPNTAAFLVFRFLAGFGGSAPLAVGAGVLTDLYTPERRGYALSIYSLAPLLGPSLGPVAGGFIAEENDWRYIFISTSAACVLIQLAGLVFLKETYEPVLLDRIARQVATDTGRPTRTRYSDQDRSITAVFSKRLTTPFRILASSWIVVYWSLFMAVYLLLTALPAVYHGRYGEQLGISSLHYIALGGGLTLGAQTVGRGLDIVYRRLKERNGGEGVPEYRLPFVIPAAILMPAGLLIFGWSAQNLVFWLVPDIGLVLVGFGMIAVFRIAQTYILDSFGPRYGASALAMASCLRSLAGFALPLAGPSMFAALGYGWGCTLLALVMILIGIAALPLWHYGPRLRARSKWTDGRYGS